MKRESKRAPNHQLPSFSRTSEPEFKTAEARVTPIVARLTLSQVGSSNTEWISDDNNKLILENRDETSGDDGDEEDVSDGAPDGSESCEERGGSGNIASDGVTEDAVHMTLEQDVVVSSCNFIPLSKVISHIHL